MPAGLACCTRQQKRAAAESDVARSRAFGRTFINRQTLGAFMEIWQLLLLAWVIVVAFWLLNTFSERNRRR